MNRMLKRYLLVNHIINYKMLLSYSLDNDEITKWQWVENLYWPFKWRLGGIYNFVAWESLSGINALSQACYIISLVISVSVQQFLSFIIIVELCFNRIVKTHNFSWLLYNNKLLNLYDYEYYVLIFFLTKILIFGQLF